MPFPKLVIFASGTDTGGGTGFENLVLASKGGQLKADIISVVSNHPNGGVRRIAEAHDVPFHYFPGPWTSTAYQHAAKNADFVATSGWLRLVVGLDPCTTINIHPGPLPLTAGLYGKRVHARVLDAYRHKIIRHSEVCMHFVTATYDDGPIFFRKTVEIFPNDTEQMLMDRIQIYERLWQPIATQWVVSGQIKWDGVGPLIYSTTPLHPPIPCP